MNNTTTKKHFGNVTGSGPANLHTKKKYGMVTDNPAVVMSDAPRFASAPNRPGEDAGQVKGRKHEAFAEPLNSGAPAQIIGIDKLHNDIGEASGFITDGYLDKSNTPYGEGAKFNFLPPGMEIDNQENAEINEMPLRLVTAMSYPGDGWLPVPRDMPE
jgi:hypothetical protein